MLASLVQYYHYEQELTSRLQLETGIFIAQVIH